MQIADFIRIALTFIALCLVCIAFAFEIYDDLHITDYDDYEDDEQIDYSYLEDPDYYGD